MANPTFSFDVKNAAAVGETVQVDDSKPSIPVPFVSATWGSLAAYPGAPRTGTSRWYATSGNTFVAVIKFGPKLRAWAMREGGNSGDPGSPHFFDQAQDYANGHLRPVYFYPDELAGHVERRYRPGLCADLSITARRWARASGSPASMPRPTSTAMA